MQRKTEPELETLEPDLEAVLASARVPPPLPQHLRARALARARAYVSATTAPRRRVAAPSERRWVRVALSIFVVLAAAAVGAALGAVLALYDRADDVFAPTSVGPDVRTTGIASTGSCCRAQ